MKARWVKHTTAQSTVEYALLIAVVIAALVAMQYYLKGASQGRLRESADQIGSQWDPATGKYTTKISSKQSRSDVVTTDGKQLSTIGTDTQQTREIDEASSVTH